jgi:IS605 OrfB family transposase
VKRTSKLYFNESNTGKLNTIEIILNESISVINQYINILWHDQKFSGKYVNFKVDTWLSARMQQALGKQALEIVKSQRRRKKKTKPVFTKQVIMLSGNIVRLEFNKNSFDVWIVLTCIGNKLKVKLPARRHKHFNTFLNNGWNIKKSVRLHKNYIDVFFEKEFKHNQKKKVVAFDCGYKKLFVSSENKIIGKDLTYCIDKIAKKKQGSKAFKRALIERNNYINKEINNIDMSDTGEVVVENLKNVTNGTRGKIRKSFMNKLQRWVYSISLRKMEMFCEVSGVHIHKVNPSYTSQTCSKCGAIDKKSRNGEIFKCTSCNNQLDSDYNASLNILKRFFDTGAYSLCKT